MRWFSYHSQCRFQCLPIFATQKMGLTGCGAWRGKRKKLNFTQWFDLTSRSGNFRMESSYCPKYEWKFWEILPWIIFQTFSFILLAMRRLHIFVLKFIGLWQSWKTVFDIYFNPKTNFKNDRSIPCLQKYVFYPRESLP